MGFTNVVVMIPFCRSPDEADRVLKVMAENGLARGEKGLEVYVMCEIPSNVILAAAFAQRFDGFSIGSNDLTQLTLGVDRDSELLAVYTANNLEQGATLEDSLKASIKDIDGVFTYVVATENELGMAKDTMAAKPMVLFESDDLVALASEEVAIRAIMPREIDTSDPYDEEVRVWQR